MARKITSIAVDGELWKKFKKHCIDLNKDVSVRLDELIKKDISNK